jgi:hypothetical protein
VDKDIVLGDMRSAGAARPRMVGGGHSCPATCQCPSGHIVQEECRVLSGHSCQLLKTKQKKLLKIRYISQHFYTILIYLFF